MTTLTAPRRDARRPHAAIYAISAVVLAILVLSTAITITRLLSTSSLPGPTTGVSWAPGGGGNEDHPHPYRPAVVGPQHPH
jgi:hypothetical protein